MILQDTDLFKALLLSQQATANNSIPPVGASATTSNGLGYSGNNNGVIVPTHSETGDNLVWVPTNGGTKYHSNPYCSDMINPIQVTLETALANHYTACKKCH